MADVNAEGNFGAAGKLGLNSKKVNCDSENKTLSEKSFLDLLLPNGLIQ